MLEIRDIDRIWTPVRAAMDDAGLVSVLYRSGDVLQLLTCTDPDCRESTIVAIEGAELLWRLQIPDDDLPLLYLSPGLLVKCANRACTEVASRVSAGVGDLWPEGFASGGHVPPVIAYAGIETPSGATTYFVRFCDDPGCVETGRFVEVATVVTDAEEGPSVRSLVLDGAGAVGGARRNPQVSRCDGRRRIGASGEAADRQRERSGPGGSAADGLRVHPRARVGSECRRRTARPHALAKSGHDHWRDRYRHSVTRRRIRYFAL